MSVWQAKAHATAGVEDMVLLSKVTDAQIVENLHKRFKTDLIYTNIGPVLIAVNPYKALKCFTDREIDLYHGAAAHENPPHIYALAEHMFQNMLIDEENQCVIISGESGAGKTESSKLLMNYIAHVSGRSSSAVQEVKNIILESNPLLEAFGNAKTLRNNNSSRFGKYFEITFSRGGEPIGGNISNFLLEKSRVVQQKNGERNFHIFYQLAKGCDADEKQKYFLADPQYFNYLSQGQTFDVEGTDDSEDFKEVKHAMQVCGIDHQAKNNLLSILAGIMHLGNVQFKENASAFSSIVDPALLEYPAYLLGIDLELLKSKLISRLMTTGARGSVVDVQLTVQQANNTRDALAKALYSRMFDWIIASVNEAIHKIRSKDKTLNLGVLDIYGFEIFQKNGFEQLCINYVNEKLQQVFIELTLKSEQEEYQREGIKWTPIDFFNNKIVVDLIELKRPAGVMAVLDDICAQLHAVTEGADLKFVQKLEQSIGTHPHFVGRNNHFVIKHYAGQVDYDSDGFCESNKDTLFRDLVLLMQSTSNPFIRSLFPEDINADDKKRPTTASFKIRNQSNDLVETLMKCTPSYIRCIKPNDKKRAGDWDGSRVEHQVRYLNLRENINVRRAGFCYRCPFDKMLRRYGILTEETYPHWNGTAEQGVKFLLNAINMDPNQWQSGRTKVFIKSPESLFMLEELRERKYHDYAVKIQRAYRRWKARKYYLDCKKQSQSIVYGKKERRRLTLNREYLGDYLSMLSNPVLRALINKNEPVLYANKVVKYDRRMKKQDRELIITPHRLVIIGEDVIKEGPNKGGFVKTVKRSITLDQISAVSLSPFCDDFFVIHVPSDYDNVFEDVFKTELISVLSTAVNDAISRPLPVYFSNRIEYTVKKTRWESSGTRTLNFVQNPGVPHAFVNPQSKKGEIQCPPGLPSTSQPTIRQPPPNQFKSQSKSRPKQAPSAAPTARQESPPQNQAAKYGTIRPAPPSAPSGAVAPPRPVLPNAQSQTMRPVLPNPQSMTLRPSRPNGTANGTVNGPPRADVSQNQYGTIRPPSANQQASSGFRPPQMRPTPFASASLDRGTSASSPNLAADSRQNAYGTMRASPANGRSQDQLNKQGTVRGKGPAPPPPKPRVDQYRALYDYEAREADELALRVGDVITLLSKDSEGWWSGVCKGKKGLFPSNYVEQC